MPDASWTMAPSDTSHEPPRCGWVGFYAGASSEAYVRYHDEEWGRPVRGERPLFELLCLEGMQAGLSWAQVLHRREAYRSAFHGFDVDLVAGMTPSDVDALMLPGSGLIRHRGKLSSIVQNARATQSLRSEGGLDRFLWSFVDHRPRIHRWQFQSEVPSRTSLSIAVSCALKRRGYAYVGPTTTYAFLQGAGLVWDHLVTCHCRPHLPPLEQGEGGVDRRIRRRDPTRDGVSHAFEVGSEERGAVREAGAGGRRDVRTGVQGRGRGDEGARGPEEDPDGQREEGRIPHHRHTRDQDPQETAPQKRRKAQRNRHLQR